MIKRIAVSVSGLIFSFCLIFILLISSVEIVCYYTPGYFEHEYEKYNVLDSLPEMNMSEEDGLMKVTKHMMSYLRGDEDELQVEVMMGGEERGFFTDREIAHMEDVRNLFVGAIMLRRAAAVLAVICVAVIALIRRKGSDVLRALSKGMLTGTAVILILSAVFAAIIATDFTDAFITFHHIFFDNDLWMLDPSTDMLINIVPEGFFFDTASRILAIFAGSVAVLAVLSALYLLFARRAGRGRKD